MATSNNRSEKNRQWTTQRVFFLFVLSALLGNVLIVTFHSSDSFEGSSIKYHHQLRHQQFTETRSYPSARSSKPSSSSLGNNIEHALPTIPKSPSTLNDTLASALEKKKKGDNKGEEEEKNNVFSICLITKDDLDILPEWIAYHYHAMELRHLVVAVDPSSKQSPTSIFDNFRSTLPDLIIEEWADEYYLPEFFLNKSYGMVPNFITEGGKNGTFQQWIDEKHIRPVIQKDFVIFNNHYYRQLRFVSQCTKHLLKHNRTYMSPLDSDEYIVINPLLNITTQQKDQQEQPSPETWSQLRPNSVMRFLEDRIQQRPQLMETGCLKMPRLLFGSVPDPSPDQIPNPDSKFNLSKFESLQWLYHAPWQDERNHMQKVILDITKIPKNDTELLGDYAFSVHQPSMTLCPPESYIGELNDTMRHPLVGNHYLGSWERYNTRQDKRRSSKVSTEILVWI